MSNSAPIYLTAEGAQKLRQELEYLETTKRQELAERLRSAIQMGDLSENADYHKAKEDQAFLEGRIQELKYTLQNAEIIDESNNGKREVVDIGATVTIQEAGYEPETYQVVGAKEANPREGKISNESPIGRAILGKRAGDEVEVQAPGGKMRFTILDVQ
ncbi:MAG: transcription elongation factor GreA [Anaerolineae bacterium]|nr:MAG: transcription elongation factor GreA [Anaerolineae bacterium]